LGTDTKTPPIRITNKREERGASKDTLASISLERGAIKASTLAHEGNGGLSRFGNSLVKRRPWGTSERGDGGKNVYNRINL